MGSAGLTGKLPELGHQQRRYRIRPVGSPVLETSLAAGWAAVLTFACSRPGRGPQGPTPRSSSHGHASTRHSRAGSHRNGEVPESLPLMGSAIFMSKSG